MSSTQISALLVIVILSTGVFRAQEAQPQPVKVPEIRQEDLNSYLAFVRHRDTPFAGEENFASLVRSSFDRVYLHQMRGGFYLKPSPSRVMKQIQEIFSEVDASRQSLRLLRGDSGTPGRKEMHRIMERFDHSAHTVQSAFQEYFNELNRGPMSVQIPQLSDIDLQWKFYLVRMDQCFGMLADQLEQYFFKTEPGRASVQDYQNPGIATITKTIREITHVYRSKLR
ncbi:MAG TPA: hypothetical protein VGL91_11965 [Acidobacteriota bacterium]|jgi:hypothetical protein